MPHCFLPSLFFVCLEEIQETINATSLLPFLMSHLLEPCASSNTTPVAVVQLGALYRCLPGGAWSGVNGDDLSLVLKCNRTTPNSSVVATPHTSLKATPPSIGGGGVVSSSSPLYHNSNSNHHIGAFDTHSTSSVGSASKAAAAHDPLVPAQSSWWVTAGTSSQSDTPVSNEKKSSMATLLDAEGMATAGVGRGGGGRVASCFPTFQHCVRDGGLRFAISAASTSSPNHTTGNVDSLKKHDDVFASLVDLVTNRHPSTPPPSPIRIHIVGEHGSGKTTMLLDMCRMWAWQQLTPLSSSSSSLSPSSMTNWGTILYVSAQDLAAATTTLTRNTAADATVGNEEAADYNIAVEVIQRALHRLLCGETDMTTSNNANNAMQRQQHIRNNNNATDAKQQTTTTTTIPRQADIFTADDIKNAFLIPYSSTSHMTTPLLAAAASVPPPSSRRLQNKNVLLLVDLGGSEEEVLPVSSDLRACLQLRRRALTAMLKLFPHYIIAGSPLQHEMLMTTATSTSPPITKMVLGHFSNSSGQLLSLIASATASATSSSPLKSKYDFSRPRVPSPPGKAAEPTLFDNAMDADDDDDESACDGFGKSNSESMNSVLEWFCRHPKRFLVAADIVMQRKGNLSSAQRSLQFVPLLLRCMLTTTDGGESDVTKPLVMSEESTTDEAFKMWGRLCAELLHRQSHVNTSASDDELTTTMLSLAVPQEVLPTRAFRNLFAFSLISLKHSKGNDDTTSAAGSVAQIVVVAPRCVIIGSAAWYHTQCAFEKLSTPSRQQPSSDYHSVTTKLLIESVVDASTNVSILFHEYLWESIDSIVHHNQQNDSSPSNVKDSQEKSTLPATTLRQALCSTLCLLPLLTSNNTKAVLCSDLWKRVLPHCSKAAGKWLHDLVEEACRFISAPSSSPVVVLWSSSGEAAAERSRRLATLLSSEHYLKRMMKHESVKNNGRIRHTQPSEDTLPPPPAPLQCLWIEGLIDVVHDAAAELLKVHYIVAATSSSTSGGSSAAFECQNYLRRSSSDSILGGMAKDWLSSMFLENISVELAAQNNSSGVATAGNATTQASSSSLSSVPVGEDDDSDHLSNKTNKDACYMLVLHQLEEEAIATSGDWALASHFCDKQLCTTAVEKEEDDDASASPLPAASTTSCAVGSTSPCALIMQLLHHHFPLPTSNTNSEHLPPTTTTTTAPCWLFAQLARCTNEPQQQHGGHCPRASLLLSTVQNICERFCQKLEQEYVKVSVPPSPATSSRQASQQPGATTIRMHLYHQRLDDICRWVSSAFTSFFIPLASWLGVSLSHHLIVEDDEQQQFPDHLILPLCGSLSAVVSSTLSFAADAVKAMSTLQPPLSSASVTTSSLMAQVISEGIHTIVHTLRDALCVYSSKPLVPTPWEAIERKFFAVLSSGGVLAQRGGLALAGGGGGGSAALWNALWAVFPTSTTAGTSTASSSNYTGWLGDALQLAAFESTNEAQSAAERATVEPRLPRGIISKRRVSVGESPLFIHSQQTIEQHDAQNDNKGNTGKLSRQSSSQPDATSSDEAAVVASSLYVTKAAEPSPAPPMALLDVDLLSAVLMELGNLPNANEEGEGGDENEGDNNNGLREHQQQMSSVLSSAMMSRESSSILVTSSSAAVKQPHQSGGSFELKTNGKRFSPLQLPRGFLERVASLLTGTAFTDLIICSQFLRCRRHNSSSTRTTPGSTLGTPHCHWSRNNSVIYTNNMNNNSNQSPVPSKPMMMMMVPDVDTLLMSLINTIVSLQAQLSTSLIHRESMGSKRPPPVRRLHNKDNSDSVSLELWDAILSLVRVQTVCMTKCFGVNNSTAAATLSLRQNHYHPHHRRQHRQALKLVLKSWEALVDRLCSSSPDDERAGGSFYSWDRWKSNAETLGRWSTVLSTLLQPSTLATTGDGPLSPTQTKSKLTTSGGAKPHSATEATKQVSSNNKASPIHNFVSSMCGPLRAHQPRPRGGGGDINAPKSNNNKIDPICVGLYISRLVALWQQQQEGHHERHQNRPTDYFFSSEIRTLLIHEISAIQEEHLRQQQQQENETQQQLIHTTVANFDRLLHVLLHRHHHEEQVPSPPTIAQGPWRSPSRYSIRSSNNHVEKEHGDSAPTTTFRRAHCAHGNVLTAAPLTVPQPLLLSSRSASANDHHHLRSADMFQWCHGVMKSLESSIHQHQRHQVGLHCDCQWKLLKQNIVNDGGGADKNQHFAMSLFENLFLRGAYSPATVVCALQHCFGGRRRRRSSLSSSNSAASAKPKGRVAGTSAAGDEHEHEHCCWCEEEKNRSGVNGVADWLQDVVFPHMCREKSGKSDVQSALDAEFLAKLIRLFFSISRRTALAFVKALQKDDHLSVTAGNRRDMAATTATSTHGEEEHEPTPQSFSWMQKLVAGGAQPTTTITRTPTQPSLPFVITSKATADRVVHQFAALCFLLAEETPHLRWEHPDDVLKLAECSVVVLRRMIDAVEYSRRQHQEISHLRHAAELYTSMLETLQNNSKQQHGVPTMSPAMSTTFVGCSALDTIRAALDDLVRVCVAAAVEDEGQQAKSPFQRVFVWERLIASLCVTFSRWVPSFELSSAAALTMMSAVGTFTSSASHQTKRDVSIISASLSLREVGTILAVSRGSGIVCEGDSGDVVDPLFTTASASRSRRQRKGFVMALGEQWKVIPPTNLSDIAKLTESFIKDSSARVRLAVHSSVQVAVRGMIRDNTTTSSATTPLVDDDIAMKQQQKLHSDIVHAALNDSDSLVKLRARSCLATLVILSLTSVSQNTVDEDMSVAFAQATRVVQQIVLDHLSSSVVTLIAQRKWVLVGRTIDMYSDLLDNLSILLFRSDSHCVRVTEFLEQMLFGVSIACRDTLLFIRQRFATSTTPSSPTKRSTTLWGSSDTGCVIEHLAEPLRRIVATVASYKTSSVEQGSSVAHYNLFIKNCAPLLKLRTWEWVLDLIDMECSTPAEQQHHHHQRTLENVSTQLVELFETFFGHCHDRSNEDDDDATWQVLVRLWNVLLSSSCSRSCAKLETQLKSSCRRMGVLFGRTALSLSSAQPVIDHAKRCVTSIQRRQLMTAFPLGFEPHHVELEFLAGLLSSVLIPSLVLLLPMNPNHEAGKHNHLSGTLPFLSIISKSAAQQSQEEVIKVLVEASLVLMATSSSFSYPSNTSVSDGGASLSFVGAASLVELLIHHQSGGGDDDSADNILSCVAGDHLLHLAAAVSSTTFGVKGHSANTAAVFPARALSAADVAASVVVQWGVLTVSTLAATTTAPTLNTIVVTSPQARLFTAMAISWRLAAVFAEPKRSDQSHTLSTLAAFYVNGMLESHKKTVKWSDVSASALLDTCHVFLTFCDNSCSQEALLRSPTKAWKLRDVAVFGRELLLLCKLAVEATNTHHNVTITSEAHGVGLKLLSAILHLSPHARLEASSSLPSDLHSSNDEKSLYRDKGLDLHATTHDDDGSGNVCAPTTPPILMYSPEASIQQSSMEQFAISVIWNNALIRTLSDVSATRAQCIATALGKGAHDEKQNESVVGEDCTAAACATLQLLPPEVGEERSAVLPTTISRMSHCCYGAATVYMFSPMVAGGPASPIGVPAAAAANGHSNSEHVVVIRLPSTAGRGKAASVYMWAWTQPPQQQQQNLVVSDVGTPPSTISWDCAWVTTVKGLQKLRCRIASEALWKGCSVSAVQRRYRVKEYTSCTAEEVNHWFGGATSIRSVVSQLKKRRVSSPVPSSSRARSTSHISGGAVTLGMFLGDDLEALRSLIAEDASWAFRMAYVISQQQQQPLSTNNSSSTQPPRMIFRSTYHAVLHRTIRAHLHSVFTASVVVSSGVVAHANSGVMGKVGQVMASVASSVPIIGGALSALGAVLQAVDHMSEQQKLDNIRSVCVTEVEAAVLFEAIANEIVQVDDVSSPAVFTSCQGTLDGWIRRCTDVLDRAIRVVSGATAAPVPMGMEDGEGEDAPVPSNATIDVRSDSTIPSTPPSASNPLAPQLLQRQNTSTSSTGGSLTSRRNNTTATIEDEDTVGAVSDGAKSRYADAMSHGAMIASLILEWFAAGGHHVQERFHVLGQGQHKGSSSGNRRRGGGGGGGDADPATTLSGIPRRCVLHITVTVRAMVPEPPTPSVAAVALDDSKTSSATPGATPVAPLSSASLAAAGRSTSTRLATSPAKTSTCGGGCCHQ